MTALLKLWPLALVLAYLFIVIYFDIDVWPEWLVRWTETGTPG